MLLKSTALPSQCIHQAELCKAYMEEKVLNLTEDVGPSVISSPACFACFINSSIYFCCAHRVSLRYSLKNPLQNAALPCLYPLLSSGLAQALQPAKL